MLIIAHCIILALCIGLDTIRYLHRQNTIENTIEYHNRVNNDSITIYDLHEKSYVRHNCLFAL